MFRWLTSLFVGGKKKDTEIRRLKVEVPQNISALREKAKKGDSEAYIKLGALRKTIASQSQRLTGKSTPPSSIIPGGLK